MDTMTKSIKKLEKESQMWKGRWENTNRSLIGMVDERTENQNTIATLKTKVDKLEKLCRALQSERKGAKKQNTDNKADTSPSLSPEPGVEVAEQVTGKQLDKNLNPSSTEQVPNGHHTEESPITNGPSESNDKEVQLVKAPDGSDEKSCTENDEKPQGGKECENISNDQPEEVQAS